MNNKVLIKADFVEYNVIFEIFVPVNELLWKVSVLIDKSASDLMGLESKSKKYTIINKKTNEVYDLNLTVKETDIRYGTELIFF